MKQTTSRRWAPSGAAILFGILLAALTATGCRQAQKVDATADRVLRQMSKELAEADQFTIRALRKIDPALLEESDVLETAIVDAWVKRPNKLAGTSTSGKAERQIWYDGDAFSLLDVERGLYATRSAPRTIDGLVAELDNKFGFSPPMSEFLVANPYRTMLSEVTAGGCRGREQLGGKECYHLAFKEELLEWELWVSAGDYLPVKFVVTATSIEGSPRITLDFLEVNLDATIADEVFEFRPPEGAREIPMLTTEEVEELEG